MRFLGILLVVWLIAFQLAGFSPVRAQYGVSGLGSGGISQILVDKEIKGASNSKWFDNLDASETLFSAGTEIEFRIRVHNTGGFELYDIKVKDFLPNYLEYVSGASGYEAGSRVADWKIERLDLGEEKVLNLRVKVVKGDLPIGTVQLFNKAEARASDGAFDSDSVAFYIKGKFIAMIPDTGAPGLLVGTIALIVLAKAGFVLRKVGRGEI